MIVFVGDVIMLMIFGRDGSGFLCFLVNRFLVVSFFLCFFSRVISVLVFVGFSVLIIIWYLDWLGKVVILLVVIILSFCFGWIFSFEVMLC